MDTPNGQQPTLAEQGGAFYGRWLACIESGRPIVADMATALAGQLLEPGNDTPNVAAWRAGRVEVVLANYDASIEAMREQGATYVAQLAAQELANALAWTDASRGGGYDQ